MTVSLVNKLLHPPTLALKRLASQNGVGMRVKLIREMFGMDPSADAAPETGDTEGPSSRKTPASTAREGR